MTKEEFIKAMETNEVFQQLKASAEKHGFICEYAYLTYYGDPKVAIYSKNHREFRDFRCSLYLRTELDFSKNHDCCESYQREMSTTSYWSIYWEELEKYIEWVNESKALYDELQNIDLLKLQVRPEKFDDDEE